MNLPEETLPEFLKIAEALKIRGLTESNSEAPEYNDSDSSVNEVGKQFNRNSEFTSDYDSDYKNNRTSVDSPYEPDHNDTSSVDMNNDVRLYYAYIN